MCCAFCLGQPGTRIFPNSWDYTCERSCLTSGYLLNQEHQDYLRIDILTVAYRIIVYSFSHWRIFFLLVLGIDTRALFMLSAFIATELHPQPRGSFSTEGREMSLNIAVFYEYFVIHKDIKDLWCIVLSCKAQVIF
jgi:hypothetical protein